MATTDDASAIAGVHCSSALVAFAGIFPSTAPAPTPETLVVDWRRLIADPGATVLVWCAPNVVGSVALTADSNVASGWLLTRLYVTPTRWGEGIGSSLHEGALALARERGIGRANLWVLERNVRARAMYERRGWRLVPGEKLVNGDLVPPVNDVLYAVDLRS